ncbi:MAG TPA: citramalate synthase [bacterium]|nr:citramalate synthase [bacterium]
MPAAKRIALYDTTLRDGTQGAGITLSADDKLRIAEHLDAFGVDYIEGGWPGSNPKDMEFFERARGRRWRHARLAAFGSTRRPGIPPERDENLNLILAAGTPAAALFGKSWDLHVREALRTTPDENLAMIEDSVRFVRSRGVEVVYDAEHFFDGWKANPEYALATLRAAERAGASVVVLCDTNGGCLPHEIRAGVEAARRAVEGPLGIHTHNDGELGVANTLVAVDAGCVHVQGTINGIGERCGNANLVSIIPNLQLKMGYRCVPETQIARLGEVSRYVAELANITPNEYQPFVGLNAFAHKGGVHVSAVMAHPPTYEHIAPEVVGNARRVVVSDLSGRANVLYKAREMGIDLSRDRPEVREILAELKRLEHEGYQFEAAEASFELLMRRIMGQHRPSFTLLGLRVTVEKRAPGGAGRGGPGGAGEREGMCAAEATIRVAVDGQEEHTAAEGDGPVHALDRALRKALGRFYPEIQRVRLVDYKVRVLNADAATAARVRVLIQSTDGARTWGTVGVSENVVEASWQALVDSLEYVLLRAAVSSGLPS